MKYVDPTGKVSWVVDSSGRYIDRGGYKKTRKTSSSSSYSWSSSSSSGGTSRKRHMTPKEAAFTHEILGNQGFLAMGKVRIKKASGGRPSAMPWGTIKLPSGHFNDPMASDYGRNSLIHEAFHHVQYSSIKGAFRKLVGEQILYISGKKDPYSFGDYTVTNLSQYGTLSDMPYLESQAQMVGDFAELYYRARYGNRPLLSVQKLALPEMSRIMGASGFESEAVRWVKENL